MVGSSNLFWLALLGCCLIFASAQKTSPRKELLTYLSSIGCTNQLVANYVIDAVTWNIPAATVVARLSIIPNVKATDLAKISDPYMKLLQTYVQAKAKGK